MLPKYHIIIGFLVSVIIYFIFPEVTLIEASIVFLSSFLIDVDHYLYYVWKKKDWSLRRAYENLATNRKFILSLSPQKRAKYKVIIMIFHGVEFWLILSLLIFVNKIFLFVLIGVMIHMILDFVEFYGIGIPFGLKSSVIYVYKTNKQKIPLPDKYEEFKK